MTDWLTEAELETHLGVTLTAETAAFIIRVVQARVRAYTGQELTAVSDDIVYLDGTGRDAFRLPERPVTDISELQEDGVVVAPGTYPDHEWKYGATSGVVFRQDGIWRDGRGNLKVTYDHGYSVDPIYGSFPADLRLVSLNLAKRVFLAIGTTSAVAGGVKQSESIGAYSYSLAEVQAGADSVDFSKTEQLVLDHYSVRGPKAGSRS